MSFDDYFKKLIDRFGTRLFLTAVFAAGVSVSAVMLLGISGWFLTGAAVAGAAGVLAAQGFNYLLPSAAIRFFAIARTVLRYGERYTGHSAALRAMAELRPALLGRVLTSDPQNTLRLSRGDASSRFIQDVATLENALVMRSAPWAGGAGILTALVLTAIASPWAALVLLIFITCAVAASLYIHRRPADDLSEAAAMGDLKARFFSLMALLPDIRAYDLGAALLAELQDLEAKLFAAKTDTVGREAVSNAATTALTGLCLASIAMASLGQPLAHMALALLAGSMGFESATILTRALSQKPGIDQAHARLAEIHDQPLVERTDTQASVSIGGQTFTPDRTLRLRIDGPSGSGKTRAIETLIGLRGASGTPGLFSHCPQDATLLTGTIRENLLMAISDAALKALSRVNQEQKMLEALDTACLKDRVMALPKELDTWIGDGGVTLSGGERKRLALARALMREAPILVLDEPTEGLDLATEARVVKNLAQRLAERSQGLILISHREGPRVLSDQVVSL
ncbi:amino acid ABC transporter ATP-binding/permease protein [Asticcacaulis sp.]|uniref:amino acid ABC transporter ATP-binding/permease protein n=1 Tax=Asticcacaulis sp. TaxID=1872648 RepID=UPI003F7C17DC